MTPSKASQHLDTSREGPRPEAVEPDQTLINSAPSLNEGRERLERLADGLSQPSFGISMTEEQALAHAADLRALLSDLSTLQQENGNLRRGLSLALEALQPFASFAADNTSADDLAPGYGIWAGNRCERERIVDWFGPTDFRRASTVYADIQKTLEAVGSPPEGGWRPIESAPRDGTRFAAYQAGDVYACSWREEEPDEGPYLEGWWDHYNTSFEEPTHWTPLPKPPSILTPPREDDTGQAEGVVE